MENFEFARENREAFWAKEAESLNWFQKWDKVLDDSKKPFYKWFAGAKFNIVANAIDRHCNSYRRNKLALIWEGENGDVKTYSFHSLNREVSKLANILKSMGVKKGDVVTIYLPQVPELVLAMLACAKIGAIHSVVFGGFSTEALLTRVEDADSRVLITADGGFRRGKTFDLKTVANEVMDRTPSIEVCITIKRAGNPVMMMPDRDFWLHDLMSLPIAQQNCETEVLDSEDPLFILYTSGTTGKPKGILHTHGGYAVYTSATLKYVFELKDEDRYWCTADPGWITGHSYLAYGPLILGATVMMYEGVPNHPYPNRWWQIIEKYGINVLYTSPTAIRGLMRYGEQWVKKHDLSSLRLLGSVGEPINPEAWKWYHRVVGKEKCAIMDTWWQTETGGFMIAPQPNSKLKPGSATLPICGNEIAVVDDHGNDCATGQEGNLVIKNPWPGMARTLWKDPERFKEVYWKTFEKQGWYKTGDSARLDEDGYAWIIGRIDEVIKVSGHRLGTSEIESAMITHPAVAESAAIGLPHELKGNAIYCSVVLKPGMAPTPQLAEELKAHVAHGLGSIARPDQVVFAESLPKTRSGKIMRRVVRARALGQDVGDTSTLEE